MVDKKLTDYIKSNLAKGHSLEEIRGFVTKHGWSQEEIDEALLEASGSPAPGPVPHPAIQSQSGAQPAPDVNIEGKKKGHKRLIIALIILIIVVFIFLYMANEIVQYFNNMFPNTALPFNLTFFG